MKLLNSIILSAGLVTSMSATNLKSTNVKNCKDVLPEQISTILDKHSNDKFISEVSINSGLSAIQDKTNGIVSGTFFYKGDMNTFVCKNK